MPRNVTVTLDDGTQHSYQNIPDDVTPDQVTQRAQKDFGKGVTLLMAEDHLRLRKVQLPMFR